MKKIIAAVVIVLLIGLYIFYRMSGTTVAPAATTDTTTSGDMGNMDMGTSSAGNTPPSTTTSTSAYKDGSYTGSVADAFYGKLQVKITVSGGLITNVTYPQYPNAPGHTTEVNNVALPVLTQEAIKIQGANVDIVSGATQTSEAFQQSLASALAQAKA
jgi:uncharacterized protein with FMN-binding domain